ncbi:MAG: HIT family protein [Bacteroidota bacterium]
MKAETCVFCKESIKNSIFAESPNYRAIYNIAPILPGHSLIIPKKHFQRIEEIPDPLLGEMMLFSRQTWKRLQKAFGADAFNWILQDGKEAGQTVMHLHLHLIPRKDQDLPEPGDWYPRLLEKENKFIDSLERPRLLPEQMKKIVEYLKKLS